MGDCIDLGVVAPLCVGVSALARSSFGCGERLFAGGDGGGGDIGEMGRSHFASDKSGLGLFLLGNV